MQKFDNAGQALKYARESRKLTAYGLRRILNARGLYPSSTFLLQKEREGGPYNTPLLTEICYALDCTVTFDGEHVFLTMK